MAYSAKTDPNSIKPKEPPVTLADHIRCQRYGIRLLNTKINKILRSLLRNPNHMDTKLSLDVARAEVAREQEKLQQLYQQQGGKHVTHKSIETEERVFDDAKIDAIRAIERMAVSNCALAGQARAAASSSSRWRVETRVGAVTIEEPRPTQPTKVNKLFMKRQYTQARHCKEVPSEIIPNFTWRLGMIEITLEEGCQLSSYKANRDIP